MEHTNVLHLHLSLKAQGDENPPGGQRWDPPALAAPQRRCTHLSAHPRQAPECPRTPGRGAGKDSGGERDNSPVPGDSAGAQGSDRSGRVRGARRHLPCTPALGCGSSAPGSSPRPLPSFIVPRPPPAMAAAAAPPAPAPPATSGPPWPEAARLLPRAPAAADGPGSAALSPSGGRGGGGGGGRAGSAASAPPAASPRSDPGGGGRRGGRGQIGGRGLDLTEVIVKSRPGAGLRI